MTSLGIFVILMFGQVEAAAADVASETAQLVQQLNEDQLATRESAEAKLIELGPQVLEHLPDVTARTPEEVRARLERVRQRLYQAAAEQSAKASRVTIQGEMSLSKFLETVMEQTGNRVVDYREDYGETGSDPMVTADFEDASFWEAVDKTLDEAGMSLYPFTLEPNSIGFVARSRGQLPAADRVGYDELFRFEAVAMEAFRDLRNPDNKNLRVALEIGWEPRLTPIAMNFRPSEIVAKDENGESLAIANTDSTIEVPIHESGAAVEIDVPISLPQRGVQSIATLSGQLTALVPSQDVTFEFDKLTTARKVAQTRGGVTVVLERAREVQELLDITILIRLESADEALQSHRGWIYNNPAMLVDGDGNQIEHVGMDAYRQSETEFGTSYKFDVTASLDRYKFVYRSPAAILTLPVKFELKDLPLP